MIKTLDIFFVFLFCFFSAASTILFKKAFNNIGIENNLLFILKWVLNPYIISGVILALACRFFSYALINSYGASGAYLLTAISIPVVIGVMHIFFNESLSGKQFFGSILIIIGVIVVGL